MACGPAPSLPSPLKAMAGWGHWKNCGQPCHTQGAGALEGLHAQQHSSVQGPWPPRREGGRQGEGQLGCPHLQAFPARGLCGHKGSSSALNWHYTWKIMWWPFGAGLRVSTGGLQLPGPPLLSGRTFPFLLSLLSEHPPSWLPCITGNSRHFLRLGQDFLAPSCLCRRFKADGAQERNLHLKLAADRRKARPELWTVCQ